LHVADQEVRLPPFSGLTRNKQSPFIIWATTYFLDSFHEHRRTEVEARSPASSS
jgi:hypothetical protein